MKQIGVQFSESQELKGKDLASVVNESNAKVFRAAMAIGLEKLNAIASRDPIEAKEVVLVTDAKAKL